MMQRQLGQKKECCGSWPCIRKQMQDRLSGVVLVRCAVFVMVVRHPIQMHLRVAHLERSIMVERHRLSSRCEGLTEK